MIFKQCGPSTYGNLSNLHLKSWAGVRFGSISLLNHYFRWVQLRSLILPLLYLLYIYTQYNHNICDVMCHSLREHNDFIAECGRTCMTLTAVKCDNQNESSKGTSSPSKGIDLMRLNEDASGTPTTRHFGAFVHWLGPETLWDEIE